MGWDPPRSSRQWRGQPGGSQLPPGKHRAVHGGAGIPRRCRQLPALLLFSRCWLKLLCRCQPLARPTPPLASGIASPGKTWGAGRRQGPQCPPILLAAWSLSLLQQGKAGMLGTPGLSSHSTAGIALGSSFPGVHAEIGTHLVPSYPGDGQQLLPTKGSGGKLVLSKDPSTYFGAPRPNQSQAEWK